MIIDYNFKMGVVDRAETTGLWNCWINIADKYYKENFGILLINRYGMPLYRSKKPKTFLDFRLKTLEAIIG